MRKNQKQVNPERLRLVQRANPASDFRIGDRVCINSGSPVGLVVDLNDEEGLITVAWGEAEVELPKNCFSDP